METERHVRNGQWEVPGPGDQGRVTTYHLTLLGPAEEGGEWLILWDQGGHRSPQVIGMAFSGNESLGYRALKDKLTDNYADIAGILGWLHDCGWDVIMPEGYDYTGQWVSPRERT